MNPPSFRLLFQGDSITDAFRRPEEVNPAHQLGNGYAFLAGSRLAADFPGKIQFLNRGISGHAVGDLALRRECDAVAVRPDALSLLIGVNGTIRSMRGEEEDTLAKFREMFCGLLNRLLEVRSGMLKVLIEPFMLSVGMVKTLLREHLRGRQDVVAEIAAEFGARLDAAQSAFDAAVERAPAAWRAYDGLHPTRAGARVLADAWMHAVKPKLEHVLA